MDVCRFRVYKGIKRVYVRDDVKITNAYVNLRVNFVIPSVTLVSHVIINNINCKIKTIIPFV